MFSGVARKDVSCLIFRRLEKKLGLIIRSIYNANVEQREVISHVDNDVFCTSEENFEMKMQEIITCCSKIHEMIGRKVQKEKVSIFCWK